MTLSQKQQLFAQLLGEFIVWIFQQPGYAVTFGEVLRTQAQATANAASGAGIKNSLHLQRLAADLNFFLAGVYQTDSAAYLPLGVKWESMHPLARWGGRFSRPDGNHFSLEHEGVR